MKMRVFFCDFPKLAQVAELADALDLGSSIERCAGSTPVLGTIFEKDSMEASAALA